MAKEKEPIRQAAEPEAPQPVMKFGNYSSVFMDSKLSEAMRGELKLTGIDNTTFLNYLMGYGLLKLQNRLDKIEKELGL